MYVRAWGWEFFAETVPIPEKFLDWDFSPSENHVWVWKAHIVFNRTLDVRNGADEADGPPHVCAD